MAYFFIENFSAGLDQRKAAYTAPAGTLRKLENGHVTPGGEIEKRKAFINEYTIPVADTVGLAAINQTDYTLYIFGHATDPGGWPTWLAYQQLTPVVGTSWDKILDWDIYDGKLFVIAQDNLGTVEYFFDGTRIDPTIEVNIVGSRYCRTFQDKMYAVGGRNVGFSDLGDPSKWSGTGSGFINLNAQDADSGELLGLEIYYDRLALLSRFSTQIYYMDQDPALNAQDQILRNIGTVAGHSVKQYGNGDILFLADSGVRSLLARDSSNSASVSDIGSPIDPILQDFLLNNPREIWEETTSVIDPITGRVLFFVGDTVYLLSNFPGPKVTAWSTYKPGFTAEYVTHAGNRIVAREGDNIHFYGGIDGLQTDASQIEIIFPFLDAENPASKKTFEAFDAAMEGTWDVYIAYDPLNVVWEQIGTFTGPTFQAPTMSVAGFSSHFALRFVSTSPTAVLSNALMHFKAASKD